MDAAGGACSALPVGSGSLLSTGRDLRPGCPSLDLRFLICGGIWWEGLFWPPRTAGDPGGLGVTLVAALPAGQTLENQEVPAACSLVLSARARPRDGLQARPAPAHASSGCRPCTPSPSPPPPHTHTRHPSWRPLTIAVSSVLDDLTYGGLIHDIRVPGIQASCLCPAPGGAWHAGGVHQPRMSE